MNIWGSFKKAFILLAATVMLLSAWPTAYLHVKPLPPLPIKKIEPPPVVLPEIEYEENYYDIKVNGIGMAESILVLKDRKGNLWMPVTALESMNFAIPDGNKMDYFGVKYISLSSLQGVNYTIDANTLTLNLATPVTAFKTNQLDFGGSKIVVPTLPPWGGFFNYNILATNASNITNANALFSINIFGPYGYGSSSFTYTTQKALRPWVRLLTTWTIDYPDTMQTLALGDDISTSTNWSGSLNFGGIQWGTNFDTQPAFYTFPLPGYRGAAIVPSNINLYVNSMMVRDEKVAPGVFDITNIPMIDGAGNVVIVTKDILGRRQVYRANYYISTALLKKGLADYTYEMGLIRNDLGVLSNVYSQFIGAITYGYGLTDYTTGQIHAEVLSYEQAVGLTLTHVLGQLGTVTGSIAGSKSIDLGRGALALFGYEYLGQNFSVGTSTQYTTNSFTQSGMAQGQQSPKLIHQMFASYALGNGSVAMNWTRQLNRESPSTSFLTGSYSTSLFHAISLVFTMVRTLSGPPNRSAFLGLSYSFDPVTSVNATYSDTIDSQQKSLQLIRQLPVGPGYGYDVTLNEGATDAKEGSFSYQNDYGTYILQGQKTEGDTGSSTYSLNVSGGMIYMDRVFKFSRTITNSFGFVKTFGIKDIQIYSQNQLIGITDESGITFVPNLLPYQETVVNLDPNTVPMDIKIDNYTKTVVPYNQSGVLIPFNVKRISNATVTLKLASGEFVPEGSVVTVKDDEQQFIVGMNGELYLGGVSSHVEGQATWTTASCTFSVNLPPTKPENPIPALGVAICKEAPPPTVAPTAAPATAPENKPITELKPSVDKKTVSNAEHFIHHHIQQGLYLAVARAVQTSTRPASPHFKQAMANYKHKATSEVIQLIHKKLHEGFNQAIKHAVQIATKPAQPFTWPSQEEQTILQSISQVKKEGMYAAIHQAVQHATA